MRGELNRAARAGVSVAALVALSLAMGACSTSSLDSILGTSKSAPSVPSAAGTPGGASNSSGTPAAGVSDTVVAAANNDTPCPEVEVRAGAATLMIGSKPGEGEPAPLDLRYQGSIINTARECHLNAGNLTIKVGVEGRIITGPAGGPGTINVPLRIAVVHGGLNPKTVLSKFASIPVTVNNDVDRVTFTHVEPDLSFPMPQPAGTVANYKIYVGFDPLTEQQQKKPARKRRR